MISYIMTDSEKVLFSFWKTTPVRGATKSDGYLSGDLNDCCSNSRWWYLPNLKKISLIVLVGLMSFADLSAQDINASRLYLSNYTFATGRAKVGSIHTMNGDSVGAYVLRGKNRKVFYIAGNDLFIRERAGNNKKNWYEVIVQQMGTSAIDTFRIANDEFADNKVIAHRGAWHQVGAPHNSIASLKQAISLGCAGSEFDVYMSADSVVFVNHDAHFQNVQIDQSPASQLHTLRLANGEPLPTLRSFLQEGLKQNTTKLVLEIKPHGISKERLMALTNQVVQDVRQQKMQAWIIYISFDYDALKKVLELDPSARVQYLNGDKTPSELAREGILGIDYHFGVLQNQPQWIQEAHDNKCVVNAWTVNDEAVMDWLLEKKADYITTDEPELLLRKSRTR